ncbi:protein ABHD11 [Lingula anatina]|uniref:sn-1-specific diacylglycerol lipase ABHD11 n=1 Tax=Lingula anatina TaxID=7574 RepID=A0A1S3JN05_LINAN|nr:protein ABHD11 [Lingula anatina]|eukprot:XP_013411324.1 protein ABHD11 [Lingula anatina]
MLSLKRLFFNCEACLCHQLNARKMSYIPGPLKLAHTVYNSKKVEDNCPLVVLHGLFGSRTNWHSLAKSMSRRGKKVITVDSRNHGDSPHCEEMDYFAMSEDVTNLLQTMEIEKAIVIGHSMGGKTAMTLALTQPELVRKLVVVDNAPVQFSMTKSDFPKYIQNMRKIQLDQSKSLIENRRNADEVLQEAVKSEKVRSFLLTNLVEKNTIIQWRCNLDYIENNLMNVFGFPFFDDFEAYVEKTLFIGGENSDYIEEEYFEEIRRLFIYAEVQYIEGAGHWVHSDKPTVFLQTLFNFISKKKPIRHASL